LSNTSNRVLVVNDDADAGELIARLCETLGLDVVRSTDAADALSDLRADAYGLVVIDLLLAGVTAGLRLLDEVRDLDGPSAGAGVVVIAATDTNRLFAFQSGADGFIVRPFHAEELLECMTDVLSRSHEERVEHRRGQLLGD
jgi:DNA-binding response OmpR family regulator